MSIHLAIFVVEELDFEPDIKKYNGYVNITILEDSGINKYFTIIAMISNLHVYCNITQIPSYFCEKSKASFLVPKISMDSTS